jgi:hypothetical protein
VSDERADAVIAAAAFLGPRPDSTVEDVEKLVDRFAQLIRGGHLVGRIQAFTYTQGSDAREPTHYVEGDTSMAVMKDTQQFTVTVEPEDSKGFDTADTLTWTEDSNGAFVTLQPSDDTLSCLVVAVAPGVANYKASDGAGREFNGVATVTSGDVASLVGVEGAVEDQPAATPPVDNPPASF